MTIAKQIAALKPGQSLRLAPAGKRVWCSVERSGDGRVLRWVRHTPNGFKVLRQERA